MNFHKSPEIILIVCEDSKSSFFYLEQKARGLGLNVIEPYQDIDIKTNSVEILGLGKAPITLVNKAIARKRNFNEKAKENQTIPYSKVYCVMDVDDHESLERAIDKINTENELDKETEIVPIISNECFEVWYLLHFEYTTAQLFRDTRTKNEFIANRRNLSRLMEKYLRIDDYAKGSVNIFKLLQSKGNEAEAIKRAKQLNQHHLSVNNIGANKIYTLNPSTQVYKLIGKLNEMAGNS